MFRFLLLTLVLATNAQGEEREFKINGLISGCLGGYPIHVSLYDEQAWEDMSPLNVLIVNPKKTDNCQADYEFVVNDGSYIVAAFEDKNKNNKLDFLFFLPREPAGFYRKFNGFSAPTFDSLKFNINSKDYAKADINLGG